MKKTRGFSCGLFVMLLTAGCLLGNSRLIAQTITFAAGPGGVLVDASIPHVRDSANGNSVSYVRSGLAANLAGTGRADIVVGAGISSPYPQAKVPLRVLRTDAGGTFSDVTRLLFGAGALPSNQTPAKLIAADFNRDGKLDLFVADHGLDGPPLDGSPSAGGGTNILLYSTADGTFVDRSATLPAIPDFTHSAAVGDINGDGILDIYVGNVWGQLQVGPYLLIGNPGGTFDQVTNALPAAMRNLSEKFTSSQLVDVDNDGVPDLVLGTSNDGGLVDSIVLFNDGNGDFTRRPRYTLPRGPVGTNVLALDIKTIDANGDGYPDLLIVGTQRVPNYTGGTIQLLINQQDGTFVDATVSGLGPRATVLTGTGLVTVQVADINGDGKPDIVAWVAAFGTTDGNMADFLWINNGDGTFAPISASTFAPPPIGQLLATDADGDGQLDLVAVQITGGGELQYQTYLNTTPRTVPSEPIIGNAAAGNGQATVSFAAPLYAGASAIASYAATCKGAAGTGMVTATGTASPITLTGLVNLVPYICTVTTTNANGTSLPSANSNPITPQGSLTVAVTGNGTSSFGSTVTFTAKLSDGSSPTGTVRFGSFGSTITGCANQAVVAKAATCTTTELPWGAQSITAIYSGDANNKATSSPAVAHSITGGLLTHLGVNVPTVAAGSTLPVYASIQNVGTASLNLTGLGFSGPFTLNQNTCGSTLAPDASCAIVINYSPTVISGPITGIMQVTHSGANSPYGVTLIGIGTSLAAPVLSGAFSPASVAVGSANATLTFALNNPNAIPLTNVNLGINLPPQMLTTASPNATSNCGGIWNGASWLGGGSPANRTAVEFLGGTVPASESCMISIAVVSTAGPGNYPIPSGFIGMAEIAVSLPTIALSIILPAAPNAPTIVTAIAGNGQGTMAFTPPANTGGLPITGYEATCRFGASARAATGLASPLTVTGLTNDTLYACSVTATNTAGTSLPSGVVSVTPATSTMLSVAAAGAGVVTSNPPGITCGSDCSENYADGTGVTLTATPLSGSTFSGWGGNCSGFGTAPTCTLTMNAAKNVTAAFAPPPPAAFALAVTGAGTGGGAVTSGPSGMACGADCSVSFASGASVTLTATPYAGSAFSGWGGACTGTGTCTVAMNADNNVKATFIYTGSAYSYDYVQKAFVAYYGRPGDPTGQAYWAGRMDAEGQSLNAIIGAFGHSDEFNRRYGQMSNIDLVTKIYQQALNRDPDSAGLNWYVAELGAGRRTLQTITLDVLNGATTAPDSTVVGNKLAVAAHYTAKVAAGCSYGTEQDGVDVITIVTALPASVAAAEAAIDAGCRP